MLNFPTEDTSKSPHKALRWGLSICTIIYILLFPILIGMAFVCSMLSIERPTETPLTMGIVIFVMSWLPLSIPTSIYFMWSKHLRNQPGKALIFAGLPFYTFGVVLFICGILDALIRNRYPW